MSTLNVRNIPDDLFVRLRVCVAEGGAKNIRAFVIKALEEKLNVADQKGKKDRDVEPGGEVQVRGGGQDRPDSGSGRVRMGDDLPDDPGTPAEVVSSPPVLRGGRYKGQKRKRATKVQVRERAARASRFDGPNAQAEEESKIGQVKFPDDHLL